MVYCRQSTTGVRGREREGGGTREGVERGRRWGIKGKAEIRRDRKEGKGDTCMDQLVAFIEVLLVAFIEVPLVVFIEVH